jgi:O-acetyl-ADP-ribose deacetylase (regulator of RNase III)
MEATDTTRSPTFFVTMDEFLEYLETRGSRNTTSPGASTGILGYPPAVAAPEAADEVFDR